ncbi:serine/arginine repetitive matrix protein 3-like [Neofelis nebulosa]|uniref:serine/arginine repetitive matrix protein 3-like n=1 Tax=Neofelis nebulosa TaxID=61452 RepID=UPI00272C78A2|nr:serine/arginine repetitive matrix protein 3-like [Neofelis nebulosa]
MVCTQTGSISKPHPEGRRTARAHGACAPARGVVGGGGWGTPLRGLVAAAAVPRPDRRLRRLGRDRHEGGRPHPSGTRRRGAARYQGNRSFLAPQTRQRGQGRGSTQKSALRPRLEALGGKRRRRAVPGPDCNNQKHLERDGALREAPAGVGWGGESTERGPGSTRGGFALAAPARWGAPSGSGTGSRDTQGCCGGRKARAGGGLEATLSGARPAPPRTRSGRVEHGWSATEEARAARCSGSSRRRQRRGSGAGWRPWPPRPSAEDGRSPPSSSPVSRAVASKATQEGATAVVRKTDPSA